MSERLGIESEVKTTVYSLSSGIGLMIGAVLGWLFKFSVNRKFYRYSQQDSTLNLALNLNNPFKVKGFNNKM
jgi:hypothetical protein